MSNEQKLKNVFMEVLSLKEEEVTDNLEYNTITAWDSVGHMQLVAAMEDAFDIMMETDDIIDLSTYAKGKEILGKYGVSFQ